MTYRLGLGLIFRLLVPCFLFCALPAAAQIAPPDAGKPVATTPAKPDESAPVPITPPGPAPTTQNPTPTPTAATKPTPLPPDVSATAPKPSADPPSKLDLALPPVEPLMVKDQKPAAIDIGGLPLAELLGNDSNFSGLGSFRQLLPKYGISTYLHGIAIGHFSAQTSPEDPLLNVDGFNNNPVFGAEFNLFVGAEILNRVFAEMQIFYSSEANRIAVDYAQLDIRIYKDLLFVRGGRFRVPLGNVNQYPDPRFTFKLPILPLFFFQVVPGEWEELGFEFYGRYSWGEGRALSYAVYVVNGLEQRVTNPGDAISGGPIANMTDNFLDNHDPDKAVGAQVQLEPIPGFSIGLSGYEGVYTIVEKKRLYIVDTHMGYTRGKFTLRGEFAATFQETESDTLLKYGGYVLGAYRVMRYLEPVLMFDGFRLDGSPTLDRFAATAGMNYYPFPQKISSASVRFAYSASFTDSGSFANNRFALQVQVAF